LKPYIKQILSAFLILFSCLGFGRFAFGMILPNLQSSLELSTTQVGFIGTANFIGYFIGILFVNILYSKYPTHKLILSAMGLQAIFMMAMITSSDYLIISMFYCIAGFLASISNISIMAYLSNEIPKNIRGKAIGIVVSASGLAIIISGQFVPFVEKLVQIDAWKTSWFVFSIIVLILAFISQIGIKKDTSHHMSELKSKTFEYFYISSFWKIGILYMIFGFTYAIYVTFFVSAVISKYDVSSSISGNFWTLVGFMSIFSGLIFGIIADRTTAYKALILVFLLQTISNFILVFDLNYLAIWISAICFGISVWSVPSLITLLTSIHFDVKKNAQVLALVTLLFALCQTIAPVGAGYIYDLNKNYDVVFLVSSILTLFAIILSIIFSKHIIKEH
jgi:predicted MFS family arabinose efflux permease